MSQSATVIVLRCHTCIASPHIAYTLCLWLNKESTPAHIDSERSFTYTTLIIQSHITIMSRKLLSKELRRELGTLNDTIDRKIIKGLPYTKEARRHKELVATLRQIQEEGCGEVEVRVVHMFRRAKSPVRRTLKRGILARLTTFGFAV